MTNSDLHKIVSKNFEFIEQADLSIKVVKKEGISTAHEFKYNPPTKNKKIKIILPIIIKIFLIMLPH
ncbi:MAG: hypothetical protein ACO2XZ_05435 [Rickettsiales bacterium]